MTALAVFRADASTTLGAGHVVRCLVLAERLQTRGMHCAFLCRPAAGDMVREIEAAGHTVVLLPAVADEARADAEDCLAALSARGWTAPAMGATACPPVAWIVADHYALDAAWERRMREATGARLMAIDGQARRAHDADLLLDPVGLPGSESRWDGLLPAHCQRLIGPRHALLRPAFRQAASLPAARDDEPPRLVLCFGGADAPDATGQVLAALCQPPALPVQIDVVIGSGYPHGQALADFCAAQPQVSLHRQPPQLAALMRRAHAALCAGGGTLLELCALQVPCLVLTIADNQIAPALALAQAGCALHLGQLDNLAPGTLRAQTTGLLSDPIRRRQMRQAQAALMAPPAIDLVDCMLQDAAAPAPHPPTRAVPA